MRTILRPFSDKANTSADQSNSDGPNQRDDHPDAATDTESVWEIEDPPPLPKAREPQEILSDLKGLILIQDKFKGLELAREQLFAPPVMLRLAGDYFVKFGSPDLVRGPMDAGDKIDSMDIHPFLSNIRKDPTSTPGTQRELPSFVFDIGKLYLRDTSSAYQPTDYRVVLDAATGSIWLFYEYYQIGLDDSTEKVQYLVKNPLEVKLHKRFDSARVLVSVEGWDDDLTVEETERSIRETGRMSFTGNYMTPATTHAVEELLGTPRANNENLAAVHQGLPPKKKTVADVPPLLSSLSRQQRRRSITSPVRIAKGWALDIIRPGRPQEIQWGRQPMAAH